MKRLDAHALTKSRLLLSCLFLSLLVSIQAIAQPRAIREELEKTPYPEMWYGNFETYLDADRIQASACAEQTIEPVIVCYSTSGHAQVDSAIGEAFSDCREYAESLRGMRGTTCKLFALGESVVWHLPIVERLQIYEAYARDINVRARNVRRDFGDIELGFQEADQTTPSYSRFTQAASIEDALLSESGTHFLSWSRSGENLAIYVWEIAEDDATAIAKAEFPASIKVETSEAAAISSDGKNLLISIKALDQMQYLLSYNIDSKRQQYLDNPLFHDRFNSTLGFVRNIDFHPDGNLAIVKWETYEDSGGYQTPRSPVSTEWLINIDTGQFQRLDESSTQPWAFQSIGEDSYDTGNARFSRSGNEIVFQYENGVPQILNVTNGQNADDLHATLWGLVDWRSKGLFEFVSDELVFIANAFNGSATLDISHELGQMYPVQDSTVDASGPLHFAVASSEQFAIASSKQIELILSKSNEVSHLITQEGLLSLAYSPINNQYVSVSPTGIQYHSPLTEDVLLAHREEMREAETRSANLEAFNEGLSEARRYFNNRFFNESADLYISLLNSDVGLEYWPSPLDWHSVELHASNPELLSSLGTMLLAQFRHHDSISTANPLYASARLMDFGIAASMAGQPGILRQALEELQMRADNASGNVAIRTAQYVALLESLTLAESGDLDAAFSSLLRAEVEGDGLLVSVRLANPDFFGSLYTDRQKLSFVTGISEDQLSEPMSLPIPSEFPGLDGRMVAAPMVPSRESISVDTPSAGATVLD